MSSGGSLALQLILLVVLILINAFFAGSEMAIVTANDTKIKKLSESGNKKAALLVKVLSKPSYFLSTIQVGVTMSGLFSSAVASESLSDRITLAFSGSGISLSLVKFLSVLVITVLLSYFTLVFGELVPKRIAMKNPEAIALKTATALKWISTIFMPFVGLLSRSTNAVARLFGVTSDTVENNVTEEEIRMMVDVGEETGAIDESEKEMINNVFDFNDRTVGDIMTHRTEIFAVEDTASISEIKNLIIKEGFSRIPVYKDDLDDIVGIVFAKDMLKFVGSPTDDKTGITEIMRAPLFVPETKRCQDLFLEFTGRKQHMAVVIDEYGGTAGIVTMEDLLESIVGSIQDEYDNEDDEYSVIDDSTYTIDGSADTEEVDRILNIKLPEGEYDTIAGFIIDRLGRIPNESEHPQIECGGYLFTVEHIDEKRIEKVRAEKLKPKKQD